MDRKGVLLFVLSLVTFPTLAVAEGWRVEDIGYHDNMGNLGFPFSNSIYSYSGVFDINGNGVLIGRSYTGRLFVYDDNGLQEFNPGLLLNYIMYAPSYYPSAINDNGAVVGDVRLPFSSLGGSWFYENGKTTFLPFAGNINANDINNSGQITGSRGAPDSQMAAFVYDTSGFTDLGTLGGKASAAADINNSGEVAGWANTSSGQTHAFLYRNSLMSDLGDLGGGYSNAKQVNDLGQVVGYSSIADGFHAFLHDGTTMADLGAPEGLSSVANGINNKGQVVGTIVDLGSADGLIGKNDAVSAFLLTATDQQMIDLNSLIDPQSQWRLMTAQGINDSGQIFGYGLYSGLPHMYLLSPDTVAPEPVSSLLGLLGGGLMLWRRQISGKF